VLLCSRFAVWWQLLDPHEEMFGLGFGQEPCSVLDVSYDFLRTFYTRTNWAIQPAMRKLLNTLHVMTQGAYLHRDGETVAIKVAQELKLRVPVHTLEGLVCWGQVSCSPPVLGLCCERGVEISFLTEQGRFLARVTGSVSGNVLLRRQQYRMADSAGVRCLRHGP
jgi:hypothetical protein